MASQGSGELILLITAGSVGMLLMAVAIILFVAFYQKKMLQEQLQRQSMEVDYQRKMIEAEMQSRENERSRLSKEIHDGVGVMLQALRATTYAVAKNASEEDRADLGQQINEITETVRSMAYNLMPASLEKFGLEETLDEFCTRMNRIKAETEFTFYREGSEHHLDKRQQLFLYRMVQEAVNNVLRHAEATEVKVIMKWSENSLALNVADNGKGFDFPTSDNKIHGRLGLGLFSLENRSAILGANLTFAPNIPKGTLLKIYLPLNGKN